ncbi:hypothetical protein DENSPDRAFT_849908 [Dentipellis sp. KUC8613]|nr:hypothetical protein DENSPDRAFT_849908 [Dentipellis sp. KUC8613]
MTHNSLLARSTHALALQDRWPAANIYGSTNIQEPQTAILKPQTANLQGAQSSQEQARQQLGDTEHKRERWGLSDSKLDDENENAKRTHLQLQLQPAAVPQPQPAVSASVKVRPVGTGTSRLRRQPAIWDPGLHMRTRIRGRALATLTSGHWFMVLGSKMQTQTRGRRAAGVQGHWASYVFFAAPSPKSRAERSLGVGA